MVVTLLAWLVQCLHHRARVFLEAIPGEQYIVPMPIPRVRRIPLIDIERINEIGGLDSPDIRRILSSFIEDLPGYLLLIDRLREERRAEEMLSTLHKLAGSARTCGFSGINRAVASWDTLANPYKPSLHSNLRMTVEASIEEWYGLIG